MHPLLHPLYTLPYPLSLPSHTDPLPYPFHVLTGGPMNQMGGQPMVGQMAGPPMMAQVATLVYTL